MFERQRRERKQAHLQTLAVIWMFGAMLASMAAFISGVMIMPSLSTICMLVSVGCAVWSVWCAIKSFRSAKGLR